MKTNNLTRAEIMAMTPRELDAAVAESFFLWRWITDRDDSGKRWLRPQLGAYYGAKSVPGNETMYFDVLPKYSADIAAAWTVHQKFAVFPIPIDATRYPSILLGVICNRLNTTLLSVDAMLFIEPQDICRAALIAKNEAAHE